MDFSHSGLLFISLLVLRVLKAKMYSPGLVDPNGLTLCNNVELSGVVDNFNFGWGSDAIHFDYGITQSHRRESVFDDLRCDSSTHDAATRRLSGRLQVLTLVLSTYSRVSRSFKDNEM